MRYFKLNGDVYAYPVDGSQEEFIKDDFELRIAYTRATFFSRTDPFIDQARIALGLTDEQVDTMWTTH